MNELQFAADGVSVAVDLSVGHIADFAVQSQGREVRPLHRAPWIDEPDLPADIAPGLERLSGDYLCAPFSRSDIDEAPGHGWPANSPWTVVSSAATADGRRAILRLDRTVLGATVEKELTLRNGHPFLYQEHRFIGGAGDLSLSHHTMGFMADGGKLSFSPKLRAETPAEPLDPDPARGRYMFAYPAETSDLSAFPTRDGATTDLHVYRDADRREDFIVLVEGEHAGPGWTALARGSERDLLLVLKNPRALPITMLWYSNGGRFFAPWNSRHLGVLGIEDGRTAIGHRQSVSENFLSKRGVPTSFALQPQGVVAFRQVIGATANAAGEPPDDVTPSKGALRLRFPDGEAVSLPFDDEFLGD